MESRVYRGFIENIEFDANATLDDVVTELTSVFSDIYRCTPSKAKISTYINYQGVNKFINSKQQSALVGDITVTVGLQVERISFKAIHCLTEEDGNDN